MAEDLQQVDLELSHEVDAFSNASPEFTKTATRKAGKHNPIFNHGSARRNKVAPDDKVIRILRRVGRLVVALRRIEPRGRLQGQALEGEMVLRSGQRGYKNSVVLGSDRKPPLQSTPRSSKHSCKI
jgi:hypothetical protein